jgi:mannosylglycoprotein endo-beta-mannosidase
MRLLAVTAAAAAAAAAAPAPAPAASSSCAPAFAPAWALCRTPVPDTTCVPAVVPGTVLTALLANGTFAGVTDPWVDDALQRIPDISVTGVDFWTFYWTTSIVVPAAGCAGDASTLALILPQLNYRATVLVGGAEVLPVGGGGARAAGMFARATYALGAVGALVGATSLAVRIAPPDHAGNASNTCKGCGQGGNHQIARDVTSADTAGWDWIVGVPDRNTGLLDEPQLQLAPSGLLLRDPVAGVVSMTLPAAGADGVAPRNATAVTLRVRVGCLFLGATAAPGNTTGVLVLTAPSLGAGPLAQVALSLSPSQAGQWLDVQMPDVALADVPLWWPHTLGPPTLHAATVAFVPDAPAARAAPATGAARAPPPPPPTTLAWALGVRSVSSEVDAALGGRIFRVNGARVFIQGGNYINADQFARGRAGGGAARYAAEVRMHASAGLNLLRLWGGSGGHPAALYAAADAAGLLVMLEFWMSGDNNGRWAGSYSWPDDHGLYVAAARDTVRLARPHACVLLYCGGNELYPLRENPPPDIAAALPALLAELHPAAAPPYVQSSMGSTYGDPRAPPVFDPVSTLAPLDGPYGVLDEREFGSRNPGLHYGNPPVRADGVPIAFQPELGSSACHEYASLARFLSPGALAAFPPANASYADPGVHPAWRYHAYLPFTDDGGWDHVYAYGAPRNTSEYAARAQLAQFVQNRALFEGFAQAQWRWYGAVVMWKSQSPWPSFRGALYDPYLATSGGYWGVRAATGGGGAPLRVSLNYATYTVVVVNTGLDALDLTGCTLTYAGYDVATGGVVVAGPLVRLAAGPLAPGGVLTPALTLAWPPSLAPGATTLLYRLALAGSDGAPAAGGDYWLSNLFASGPQDFASLGALRDAGPPVALAVAAAGGVGADGVLRVNVTLAAPADAPGVALGVTVTLRDPAHPARAATGAVDDRVLPAWASHGYACLVPGETLVVRVEADWHGRPAPAPGDLRVAVAGFTARATDVAVALAAS